MVGTDSIPQESFLKEDSFGFIKAEDFESLGILQEITGKQRDRVFRYGEWNAWFRQDVVHIPAGDRPR